MHDRYTSDDRDGLESSLRKLSLQAGHHPSRLLYEQMAECYLLLGEVDEARIMLDLARNLPGGSAAETVLSFP